MVEEELVHPVNRARLIAGDELEPLLDRLLAAQEPTSSRAD